MVWNLSKSLEDLEKELAEVEPVSEEEIIPKKKVITAIIFGYLFWLISYMLIYIYNNPGSYSSVSDISNVIVISMTNIPALGYQIIDSFLNAEYVTGAELLVPAIIAGVISGLVSKKPTNGILVGAIVWFLGILISVIAISYTYNFDINALMNAVLSILNDSLFLDPLILAIFGGLGGLIRSRG